MLIAKILILQIFWYGAVYFADTLEVTFFSASLILAIANLFIYLKGSNVKLYALTLLGFLVFGIYETYTANFLGLVDYKMESFPLWLMSLYVVFICYYGDALDYLADKNVFLLAAMGAIGGAGAFYGGVKISPIVIKDNQYFLFIAINWAFFFPISMKAFYRYFKSFK